MTTRRQTSQPKPARRFRLRPLPVREQRGFTIADATIATAIFAAIMLICLEAFLSLSRIYSKGLIEIKTQEVSRVVIDEISRTIATTAVDFDHIPRRPLITGDWEAFCIAGVMYSFRKNYQLERAPPPGAQYQTDRVLVKSIVTEPGTNKIKGDCENVTDPRPPPADESLEMLDYRMRINEFSIEDHGHLHTIKLDLIYGGNPDNEVFEKEVFDFVGQVESDPGFRVFNDQTRCELREAFCFILRLEREVYQLVIK